MKKTREEKNAQELTKLLQRINSEGNVTELRQEAKRLLGRLHPNDMAAAEKYLLESGFSQQLVNRLEASFMLMGVTDESGANHLREKLPPRHVLRTIIAEHEMTRCFLADLEEINERVQAMSALSDTMLEFRRLAHIIEHLDALEEHFEREDDTIFPYLRQFGWSGMCKTGAADHVYIRIAITDLIRLIGGFDKNRLHDFKVRLGSTVKYLVDTLNEHMAHEDNVIFPIAVEMIKDEKLWDRLKEICDEIGYCGIHM